MNRACRIAMLNKPDSCVKSDGLVFMVAGFVVGYREIKFSYSKLPRARRIDELRRTDATVRFLISGLDLGHCKPSHRLRCDGEHFQIREHICACSKVARRSANAKQKNNRDNILEHIRCILPLPPHLDSDLDTFVNILHTALKIYAELQNISIFYLVRPALYVCGGES